MKRLSISLLVLAIVNVMALIAAENDDLNWIIDENPQFDQAQLNITPLYFEIELAVGETTQEILYLTNSGDEPLDYTLDLCNELIRDLSRDINDSFIECDAFEFMPGATITWNFTLHNGSLDQEALLDVIVTFPETVSINYASDFIGGSGGDMLFDEVGSQDNILHWHGEDGNGMGVIMPGESATAEINVTLGDCLFENIELEYHLFGDLGGMYSDLILLRTLCIGWCSMNSSVGTLQPGETHEIQICFNAAELDENSYIGSITIDDNLRDQIQIPLELNVVSAGISEQTLPTNLNLVSFPNPFNPVNSSRGIATSISYSLPAESQVNLEIFDLKGRKIATLLNEHQARGDHSVDWNGCDQEGKAVSSGIYFCKLSAGKNVTGMKLGLLK